MTQPVPEGKHLSRGPAEAAITGATRVVVHRATEQMGAAAATKRIVHRSFDLLGKVPQEQLEELVAHLVRTPPSPRKQPVQSRMMLGLPASEAEPDEARQGMAARAQNPSGGQRHEILEAPHIDEASEEGAQQMPERPAERYNVHQILPPEAVSWSNQDLMDGRIVSPLAL